MFGLDHNGYIANRMMAHRAIYYKFHPSDAQRAQ